MVRRLTFLTLCFGLGACTQFPDLDSTITPELEAAGYPALVPIDPLLARANVGRVDQPATETQMQNRLAGLQARAARLRGPVLSGRERQRLDEGLQ